ncbi:hypothetical protein B0H11DRAFT_1905120 [Mycena galericulata]|nr:hypothetical protein B0H11DRAFT_1905120 [Mycena galericulata]
MADSGDVIDQWLLDHKPLEHHITHLAREEIRRWSQSLECNECAQLCAILLESLTDGPNCVRNLVQEEMGSLEGLQKNDLLTMRIRSLANEEMGCDDSLEKNTALTRRIQMLHDKALRAVIQDLDESLLQIEKLKETQQEMQKQIVALKKGLSKNTTNTDRRLSLLESDRTTIDEALKEVSEDARKLKASISQQNPFIPSETQEIHTDIPDRVCIQGKQELIHVSKEFSDHICQIVQAHVYQFVRTGILVRNFLTHACLIIETSFNIQEREPTHLTPEMDVPYATSSNRISTQIYDFQTAEGTFNDYPSFSDRDSRHFGDSRLAEITPSLKDIRHADTNSHIPADIPVANSTPNNAPLHATRVVSPVGTRVPLVQRSYVKSLCSTKSKKSLADLSAVLITHLHHGVGILTSAAELSYVRNPLRWVTYSSKIMQKKSCYLLAASWLEYGHVLVSNASALPLIRHPRVSGQAFGFQTICGSQLIGAKMRELGRWIFNHGPLWLGQVVYLRRHPTLARSILATLWAGVGCMVIFSLALLFPGMASLLFVHIIPVDH